MGMSLAVYMQIIPTLGLTGGPIYIVHGHHPDYPGNPASPWHFTLRVGAADHHVYQTMYGWQIFGL